MPSMWHLASSQGGSFGFNGCDSLGILINLPIAFNMHSIITNDVGPAVFRSCAIKENRTQFRFWAKGSRDEYFPYAGGAQYITIGVS